VRILFEVLVLVEHAVTVAIRTRFVARAAGRRRGRDLVDLDEAVQDRAVAADDVEHAVGAGEVLDFPGDAVLLLLGTADVNRRGRAEERERHEGETNDAHGDSGLRGRSRLYISRGSPEPE